MPEIVEEFVKEIKWRELCKKAGLDPDTFEFVDDKTTAKKKEPEKPC